MEGGDSYKIMLWLWVRSYKTKQHQIAYDEATC